jgi:VanZ family protein
LILTLVWLFLVLLFSIIPTKSLLTGHHTDKIIHFVIYGITAIILLRALWSKTSLTKSIVLSISIASLYGLAIELLQSVLPWRKFSFMDLLANVGGAFFFTFLYALKNYRRKKI